MSCNSLRRRLVPGDLVRDGGKIGLQRLDARQHLGPMGGQHLAPGVIRRLALRTKLRKRLNASDRHPGRLQAHDELQPVQIGRRVQPVSGWRTPDGTQQASLLVVT